MARIISFQDMPAVDVYYHRGGFTSINLETVRGMSGGFQGYFPKEVKYKRSLWDILLGKPDFYYVDDESRPIYRLTLQYKNHRQEDDTFYFDKEEYERVKVELARYGWRI